MKYTFKISANHFEQAKSLDFNQKIDVLCCPNYNGSQPAKIQTGAAFFHADKKSKLKTRIRDFKALAGNHSLITTDMENGPGEMILGGSEFPEFFGLCSQNVTETLYEVGKVAALEGREVGFNWTLGPCVDIAENPDSPAVGSRSSGRSPEEVIKKATAYIHGLQQNGLVATAKHFPGDGFGIYDQHLTTPENPLTMSDWRKLSGRVFQEVIDAGVMAIMPGHISLPAYDQANPKNGVYPPATLSPRLMVDLLRGELGFEGIIVSDAVGMGGIVGYMNVYDACATFFESGGDLLLFPKIGPKFYDKMKACVKKGILSEETLIDRTARVLAFKEDLLERGFFKEPVPFIKSEHEKLADDVTKKTISIVRDRNDLIPKKTQNAKKVLHVIIRNEMIKNENHIYELTQELKKNYNNVQELSNPGPDRLFDLAESQNFDLIICSIVANYNFGTNVIRLNGLACRNLMQGWMHLETPVVFVSHNHPFIELEYKAVMDTIINTYGSTPTSSKHVCALLNP